MKINLTSMLVDDQDTALQFYTEVLGFVKKTDEAAGDFRWLTVVAPEGSDDVKDEAERLKSHRVVFTMEPTETEWGTMAIFDDTCGNLIQLHQA